MEIGREGNREGVRREGGGGKGREERRKVGGREGGEDGVRGREIEKE